MNRSYFSETNLLIWHRILQLQNKIKIFKKVLYTYIKITKYSSHIMHCPDDVILQTLV